MTPATAQAYLGRSRSDLGKRLIATLIGPVIITPMASDPFTSWSNRTVLRPGREEPYLSIQDIVVFVRDLEVSKQFYLQQLGFELVTEQRLPTGERWIEVAPPDGSANLALVEPKPESPEYKLIGGYRWGL